MSDSSKTSKDSAEGASSSGTTETAVGKSTDWSNAVKRVRETNQWIVKSFVGLGALLLGTTPLLAYLKDLRLDEDRGLVAAVGILASLVGAATIAWLASNVSLTEITEINQLAAPNSVGNDRVKRRVLGSLKQRIEGSPTARWLYLFGEPSINKLLETRRKNVAAVRSQVASLYRLSPTISSNNTQVENPAWKEVQGYIKQSRDNVAAYDLQLTWLADWASFETITARFKVNRRWMAAAGLLTFLGLCTWVLALGADLSEKKEGSSSAKSDVVPAGVGLLTWAKPMPPTGGGPATPSNDGQTAARLLRAQLQSGSDSMALATCDSVGVLLESGTGSPESPWQVSVLPRDPCPVKVRFSVDRRLATLAAFKPTDNPKTAVTINRDELTLGLWVSIAAGVVLAVVALSGGFWLGRRRSS